MTFPAPKNEENPELNVHKRYLEAPGSGSSIPAYTTPASSIGEGLAEWASRVNLGGPTPPQVITHMPSNQGTYKLDKPITLEHGNFPGYAMTDEWMGSMMRWFGVDTDLQQKQDQPFDVPLNPSTDIPQIWYDEEKYGGDIGPHGEALPEGALYWDYYGKPYFGTGTSAFLNFMRYKLDLKDRVDMKEKWGPIAEASVNRPAGTEGQPVGVAAYLGMPAERAHEIGEMGLGQKIMTGTSMLMDFVGDVFNQIENQQGWLGEIWGTAAKIEGGLVEWLLNITLEENPVLGDRWKEDLFGKYVTSSAKRGDIWLEEEFGFDPGEELDRQLIDDVRVASVIGATAFFDVQKARGAAEDIRDGMDPRLVHQKWEDPLATMVFDLSVGNLIDPLFWATGGASGLLKFLKKGSDAAQIARYFRMTDDLADGIRAYSGAVGAAEDVADVARQQENAARIVLEQARAFANKTGTLADNRGFFGMTADGKRGFTFDYTQNYIARVAHATRNNDGTLNTDRMMEVLRASALPFSGSAEDAKEAVAIWARYPEFSVFWGEQGKVAGNVLHQTVFGPEGTRSLDWFVKTVEEAGGDIGKLIEDLADVNKQVVDNMFPTLTEVVQQEKNALKQARTMGMYEGMDDASIIRQMTGRDPVPGWRLRLDATHQTLQNFPFIGYKALNQFFSTIYMGMSPGYAMRNMISNYMHAIVDGGFGGLMRSATKADAISEGWLGYVPRAALVGFGGEISGAVDISSMTGIQRKLNIFSQLSARAESNAASKIVARTIEEEMKKAIDVIARTDEVKQALGPQLESRVGKMLIRRLWEEKGHVGKVAEWFRNAVREGEVENWRGLFALNDETIEGLKSLRAVDVEDQLIHLIRTADSPTEFARGVEGIKDTIRRIANMAANHYTSFDLDDLNIEGAEIDTWRRLIDDGVQGQANAILWAARTAANQDAIDSWGYAHRMVTNSISARIGAFLGKLVDTGYIRKADIDDIVKNLFSQNEETLARATASARAEFDALRASAWKADNLIKKAEPSEFGKILKDNGFPLDRPRLLTRQSAIKHIWETKDLQGKIIWDGRRLATARMVTEDINGVPERISAILLGDPRLAQVPEDVWASMGGADALVNELTDVVTTSPLIKIAQRADDAAARWGQVTPSMFIALGGAYVTHPGAKRVLDVFTSLGMPTAGEDGVPFSLRSLSGMLKIGGEEIGLERQIIERLFTAERMRRSFEWADEDLEVAEQAARGWIRQRFPEAVEIEVISAEMGSEIAEELGRVQEAQAQAQAAIRYLPMANANDVEVPVEALLGRMDWVAQADNPGEFLKNFSDPALAPGIQKVWSSTDEFADWLRNSDLPRERVDELLRQQAGVPGVLPENPNFWRDAYDFLNPAERTAMMQHLHSYMRDLGFTSWDYNHATMLRGFVIKKPDGTFMVKFTTDGSHGMMARRLGAEIPEGSKIIAQFDRDFTGVAELAEETAAATEQVGRATVGGARMYLREIDSFEDVEQTMLEIGRLGIRPDQISGITVEGEFLGGVSASMPMADLVAQYPVLREAMLPSKFSNKTARMLIGQTLENALTDGLAYSMRANDQLERIFQNAIRGTRIQDRGGFFEPRWRQIQQSWNARQQNALFRAINNKLALDPDAKFTRAELLDLFAQARDMPDNLDTVLDEARAILTSAGMERPAIDRFIRQLEFDIDEPLAREMTVRLLRQSLEDGHLGRQAAQGFEELTTEAAQIERAARRLEIQEQVRPRVIQALDAEATDISKRIDDAELTPADAEYDEAMAELQQIEADIRLLEADIGELNPNQKVRRLQLIEGTEFDEAGNVVKGTEFKNLTHEERAVMMQLREMEEGAGPTAFEVGTRQQITRTEMYDWLEDELGFNPRQDPLKPPMGPGVTPSFAQAVNQNLGGLLKVMDDVKEQVTSNWGNVTRLDDLPAGDLEGINKWEEAVRPIMAEAQAAAENIATGQRKRTLLDYQAKYGFDQVLNYIFPYQFWYGRTYYNWMKRLWDNPRILTNYARYRRFVEKKHAGMPDWWKLNWNTNELFGLDSDNPLYFNLEQNLNPLYGLVGPDFDIPDRAQNQLSAMVDGLGKFGPSVWTPYQLLAALNHKFKGEDDAAAAMAGRLFPQSALTHHILGRYEELPNWMREWDPAVWIFGDGIDYWERRRIGRELYALVEQGKYSLAQAIDAGRLQEGPIWEEARTAAIKKRTVGALSSFLGGPSFKGRTEQDIQLDQFFSYRNTLIQQADSMSPDEYANAWNQLREAFPYMDAVLISRQPSPARDRSLTYNVLARIPPGQHGVFVEWAGIPSELIDQFYDSKGMVLSGTENPWREGDHKRFMAGIVDLAAILEVPVGTRAEEWNIVRAENRSLRGQMAERFGDDIHDKIDVYFATRNKNEDNPEVAYDYLKKNPIVEQAMDWKSSYIINNPLLNQYYGGVDYIEKYMKSLMYSDAERIFGDDIFELQSVFWDVKEGGGDTRAFLAATTDEFGDHGRLKAYWEWKDGQTVLIEERLADFGEKLNPLADAALRRDVQDETFGMLSVLSGLFEAQADYTDPREIEMDAFAQQWITGEGAQEIEVPRISGFYEEQPYEYVARFIPDSLRLKLERYFDKGEPLSTETRSEINNIWELMGRPGNNMHDWLSKTLRDQYLTGGAPTQKVPEPFGLAPYTDTGNLWENFMGTR